MIHHVMYLVVNQDLEMSPGKIGAHTAHAVFDYLFQLKREMDDDIYQALLETFKFNGDTIIVLKAPEKELLKLEAKGYLAVRDEGRTEIPANSLTVVNLGIFDKTQALPNWLKRLRVL